MITIEIAKQVLHVVDKGLCSGLGTPTPGDMCVEAAVCFALGEPHSDNPSCVAPVIRRFKIALNDAPWSSNSARAIGMRKLAVAQLGSKNNVDENAFAIKIAELTIRRILPKVLREAGLNAAADRCENEGTESAALSASYAADCSADADADCSAAAAAAANYAAAAANYAAAAATAATSSSCSAAIASAAAASATAASCAARSASASDADIDSILNISAGACLDALKFVNAPGITLLKELGLE